MLLFFSSITQNASMLSPGRHPGEMWNCEQLQTITYKKCPDVESVDLFLISYKTTGALIPLQRHHHTCNGNENALVLMKERRTFQVSNKPETWPESCNWVMLSDLHKQQWTSVAYQGWSERTLKLFADQQGIVLGQPPSHISDRDRHSTQIEFNRITLVRNQWFQCSKNKLYS